MQQKSLRIRRRKKPLSKLSVSGLKSGFIAMIISVLCLESHFLLYQGSYYGITNSGPPLSTLLPEWIQNYVKWHKEMRAKFPGDRLFTDPNAPKLLVRSCLGLCGGLNDRLGQLPWDLYLANQTQRVLLLNWHRPVPIENFLVPNELDWSVPRNIPGFFPKKHEPRVDRKGLGKFRDSVTDMFDGYRADRPDKQFFDEHLDLAIKRANDGEFKDKKILRHRILGHLYEDELEARLERLGEQDMLHSTKSFGRIFHMFFKPAPAIQSILDSVYRSLGIDPRHYSAVHCRVRHPKSFASGKVILGKDGEHKADKTGLPWEGDQRQYAIETAVRAVECAKTLKDDVPSEPIYFFSDSNDLVRFMSHELTSRSFVTANQTLLEKNPWDMKALETVTSAKVVSRDSTAANAHIDLQKGKDPPEYYSTFVDLYLAINARCVTFGVGYYAVFATKISGTSCKLLYQREVWGMNGRKHDTTEFCELPGDNETAVQ